MDAISNIVAFVALCVKNGQEMPVVVEYLDIVLEMEDLESLTKGDENDRYADFMVFLAEMRDA